VTPFEQDLSNKKGNGPQPVRFAEIAIEAAVSGLDSAGYAETRLIACTPKYRSRPSRDGNRGRRRRRWL